MIIKNKNFTENRKHEIWSNIEGRDKQYTGAIAEDMKRLIKEARKKFPNSSNIDYWYNNILSKLGQKVETNENVVDNTAQKITCMSNIINFFKEFDFEPNFRFVNTLTLHCLNYSKAREYVRNYFELKGDSQVASINEKMSSSEFKDIFASLKSFGSSKQINKRFKLYYGSQGTGKTTQAIEETGGECMVCHSAMLPSDLMEDFDFEEGKATFKPSALWKAMEEGKAIVLDEINLLPFDSLRFLQTLLDDKKCFNYKGREVHINDGFKIIGTMNLIINGSVFGLPEPLVDRCEEIRKYQLTAEQLVGALD